MGSLPSLDFDGFTDDPETVTEVTVNVINEGDVALFCDIVGAEPQPEILWYVDSSVISQSDSGDNKYYRDNGQYLVITDLDVAVDVTGRIYRCEVTNVRLFETQMSNTTYVLLNNPSLELTFYKRLENKTAVVGESAEFTLVAAATGGVAYSSCDVEGGPIGVIQTQGTGLLDIAVVPRPDGFPNDLTFEVSCRVFPVDITETAILTVQGVLMYFSLCAVFDLVHFSLQRVLALVTLLRMTFFSSLEATCLSPAITYLEFLSLRSSGTSMESCSVKGTGSHLMEAHSA